MRSETIILIAAIVVGCDAPQPQHDKTPTSQTASDRNYSSLVISGDRDEYSNRCKERELEKWHARPEDETVPCRRFRRPEMDIAGDWEICRNLNGSVISINLLAGKTYDIDFTSGGCTFRWRLRRTGTYSDGTLTLNRPVHVNGATPFDKLYAIRLGGKDMLLPSSSSLLGIERPGSKFVAYVASVSGIADVYTRAAAPIKTAHRSDK